MCARKIFCLPHVWIVAPLYPIIPFTSRYSIIESRKQMVTHESNFKIIATQSSPFAFVWLRARQKIKHWININQREKAVEIGLDDLGEALGGGEVLILGEVPEDQIEVPKRRVLLRRGRRRLACPVFALCEERGRAVGSLEREVVDLRPVGAGAPRGERRRGRLPARSPCVGQSPDRRGRLPASGIARRC